MGVKLRDFGIVLVDEELGGYSSGDLVSGQVLLELSEGLAVTALRLEARGCARVNWIDKAAAPGSAAVPTRYREEVVYLQHRQTLREAPGNQGCFMLQPGKHEFPFSFQLPQGPLVTSFNGKYGSVKYWVTAILERPYVPIQIVKREFCVTSQIDVNAPNFLDFSTFLIASCFATGEAIPIYAEFENCSSRLIMPKAAIFQTQTYLANEKTKTFRQMIANVRGNHVASGSTESWNGKALKIPPVTPSILDCCIIRVEYSLAVYVHIPGSKKLMLELPIVIGTIPYSSFGSRTSSMCSQFSMDMSWLQLALPEQPEAPPNYADVVSEEDLARQFPSLPQADHLEHEFGSPMFAYIQEFRFQPPPIYSEVDPNPTFTEEMQREISFEI
ncbi:arrestin domain-containing protein 4 isoform X2 [Rhincodon typus]|uniref:arrestin domain-containing protein 4 isoform X2 n=1 Tax=Rhincodon typus TaxID=259920 RepID=UPI00202F0636|nr:arrestin domain-containing protein 4 isoform X2 [Rhincodon typus]